MVRVHQGATIKPCVAVSYARLFPCPFRQFLAVLHGCYGLQKNFPGSRLPPGRAIRTGRRARGQPDNPNGAANMEKPYSQITIERVSALEDGLRWRIIVQCRGSSHYPQETAEPSGAQFREVLIKNPHAAEFLEGKRRHGGYTFHIPEIAAWIEKNPGRFDLEKFVNEKMSELSNRLD
jgi:hypothetical protein